MTEEKLMALLKDMSLKEKIGQMMQLDVSCFKNEGPVTGSEVDQGISGEDLALAGSILGAIGAQEIKGLQKRCMEKQPHHIPVVFMADIINGYKTIFPIPLALGCTFSQEDARTAGDVMARASGSLHQTFCRLWSPYSGKGIQQCGAVRAYTERGLSSCLSGGRRCRIRNDDDFLQYPGSDPCNRKSVADEKDPSGRNGI